VSSKLESKDIGVDETVSIGNESSSSSEDGPDMICEDSISCFKDDIA
jgi:hypothetical protein